MRIALLEDDPDQSELLGLWLEDAEHTIIQATTGRDFLRDVRRESFDLYLIDWLLPDLSGIDVLHKLRDGLQDFTPVLIATVKKEERDIVQALEAGADDYLVKPIRRGELIARVDAVCRRASGGHKSTRIRNADPYVIDEIHKQVRLNDNSISLTSREFDLTAFLFRNTGKVVSRGHILQVVWGIDNNDVSTRTVDTHISRLRKKLGLNGTNGWKLSAIYQHGYRLEQPAANVE